MQPCAKMTAVTVTEEETLQAEGKKPHEDQTNVPMCIYLACVHVAALWGCAVLWRQPDYGMKAAEVLLLYQISSMGITAGCHRMWSHRSFQARTPTRILFMILASTASQGSVYHWCRDHRTHHRHSDTSKDPHDSNRGFFYSHMGWLLIRKPQEVIDAGNKIDCSDLMDDWVRPPASLPRSPAPVECVAGLLLLRAAPSSSSNRARCASRAAGGAPQPPPRSWLELLLVFHRPGFLRHVAARFLPRWLHDVRRAALRAGPARDLVCELGGAPLRAPAVPPEGEPSRVLLHRNPLLRRGLVSRNVTLCLRSVVRSALHCKIHIILNTKFLIFDTQFLVFVCFLIHIFLVFNTKFINFRS